MRIVLTIFICVLIFSGKTVYSQNPKWKSYSDSGLVYQNQKQNGKAIEYYLKAKNELIKDSASSSQAYAQMCGVLATLYAFTQEYVKSEQNFFEAISGIRRILGEDHNYYYLLCNALGILYQQWSKYDKAETVYLQMREVLKKKGDTTTQKYAETSTQLGTIYERLGQHEKSFSLLQQGLRITENIYGKETPEYANASNGLGILYVGTGQYAKAEPYFMNARKIFSVKPGKNHPDYAAACTNLGLVYENTGRYILAESFYIEGNEIFKNLQLAVYTDYALSCNNVARLYMTLAKFEKAEELYVKARNIFDTVFGHNNLLYALASTNLGVLYTKTGKYKEAERLYLEAKEIRKAALGTGHLEYSNSCINLGELYYETGDYQKAEKFYSEARNIRSGKAWESSVDYAKTSLALGKVYMMTGEAEKAEHYFLEAKRIIASALGIFHTDYSIACTSLAILYIELGQYLKAEPLLLSANSIRERVFGKEHPEYAASCINLGKLYAAVNLNEKSIEFFEVAVRIRKQSFGELHPEYLVSCNNLAVLLTRTGNYKKAEELLLNNRAVLENRSESKGLNYASNCNSLGILYEKTNQLEKAERFLKQSRGMYETLTGKENDQYYFSCISLGNVYRKKNDHIKAMAFYKEANTLQQGKVKKIFAFTNENEKELYLQKTLSASAYYLSEQYVKSSQGNQEFTYDLALSNRNRILSSVEYLKKSIYYSKDPELKKTYDKWLNVRAQLAVLKTNPNETRSHGFITLLQDEADLLEKELNQRSTFFKNEQQFVGWKSIQQQLKTNEAAIEFVSFPYYDGNRWTDSVYYAALVVRKTLSAPILIPLFERKELEKLWNKTTGNKTEDIIYATVISDKPDAKSLYSLIWKPIEKHLSGINTVYFSLTGDLHKISFAAIPVNSKQVLVDKYQLVQLNTTASIVDRTSYTISASDNTSMYGGVIYNADSTQLKNVVAKYGSSSVVSRSAAADLFRGNGWNYLPGTAKEIEQIEQLFKTGNFRVEIFSGINATEESVKRLDANSSPAILHIATHGFFFPNPLNEKTDIFQQQLQTGAIFRKSENPLFRAGLLFAGANNAWRGRPVAKIEDGILTAYEVSNLYLPSTKLVVLSACETGLGDIQGSEGVYGLQRAFKMAGAQNLIMSLWKVPDEETAEFMLVFYKGLFEKKTVSDAFYEAQKLMKNKYREQPQKWGAWVLISN